MLIDLRIHHAVREIPEAAWSALDGVAEAPFLSWTFLDALEETGCVGGRTGWVPYHMTFWDSGKLVAAAPAYLKDNSEGEFVFDHGWASAAHRIRLRYYPKLIVAVPFTPATAPRLLVASPADRTRLIPALAEALRTVVDKGELSSAHVLFPTEGEAEDLAAASAGFAHRLGIQFHWHNEGFATFDDFLAKFSSKRRNQIKRERREMQSQGIELTTARGDELTPEVVDAMYEFYVATVDKFYWGRRYLNRAFFESITSRLRGSIEVVLAREGKKILAGAFNIAGPKALFGRYWGAREERPFLHFNVCYYHSIEQCILRGLERFEAGAGGSHKMARGFEPSLTHSAHFIADKRLDGAVRDFLDRERPAIREAADQKALAWK
ncbi:MAG TPA: GNAT family N-acetyltransferase [Polyangiaceae bacterium]|jgi:predicted N-acyltransferase|nr:GNAT family N-acetyltransferase [Polyangiaceae bacterium]